MAQIKTDVNYGPTTTHVTVEMPDSLSYGTNDNSIRVVTNADNHTHDFTLVVLVTVQKRETEFQPVNLSKSVHPTMGTDMTSMFSFKLGDNLWGELTSSKTAYANVSVALSMYGQTWSIGSKGYTIAAGDDMKPTFDLAVSLPQRMVFQGITPITVKILNESLKYSATEASAKIAIGGKTYDAKTATVTPDAVGSLPISATVVDSRGFSVTKSSSVYVNMYIAPRLEDVLATRVDGSGSQSFEGTNAAVVVTFESGNNPNVATTCSLAYRENGATQFTPVGSVESGERAVIGGLLASKSYEIRATVTDGITTESKSVFLSGNTVTMDFLANGKGVAFGCEATKEGFECAMSATFTPPIPNESLDAAPRDHTHDYAASGHKHSAGDITSGTLPVARGGTGKTAIAGPGSLLRAMFDTNLTKAGYVTVFDSADGGGYMNMAQLRSAMGISSHVTAEGNSGIWHYRKYSNGYAEAWGSVTFTPSGMTNDNWRWLSTSHASTQSLPFTFKKVMTADVSYNNPAIFSVIGVADASGTYTSINATKIQYWCISAVAVATSADAYIYVCGTY